MKLKDIFRYKNFISLALTKKNKSATAKLWNGLEISGSHKGEVLNIVEEIFFKDDYRIQSESSNSFETVIDIGANIGTFSLLASRKSRRVYSFEPFPENYNYLMNNLKANRVNNVTPINKAISKTNGTEKLYLGDSLGGHSLFDLSKGKQKSNYVEIETITLADFFNEYKISEVDFMKIDCEGAEGYIFDSTSDDVLKRVHRYAIEFHDNVSILNHKEIIEKLTGLKYSCELVDNGDGFGYIYARA